MLHTLENPISISENNQASIETIVDDFDNVVDQKQFEDVKKISDNSQENIDFLNKVLETTFDDRLKLNYKNYRNESKGENVNFSSYNTKLSDILVDFTKEVHNIFYGTKIELYTLKKQADESRVINPAEVKSSLLVGPLSEQTLIRNAYEVYDKPPDDASNIGFTVMEKQDIDNYNTQMTQQNGTNPMPSDFFLDKLQYYVKPRLYNINVPAGSNFSEECKKYLSIEEQETYETILNNKKTESYKFYGLASESFGHVFDMVDRLPKDRHVSQIQEETIDKNKMHNVEKNLTITNIFTTAQKLITDWNFPDQDLGRNMEMLSYISKYLDTIDLDVLYADLEENVRNKNPNLKKLKKDDFKKKREDMLTKIELLRNSSYPVSVIANPITTVNSDIQTPRGQDPQQMLVIDPIHHTLVRYPISLGKLGVSAPDDKVAKQTPSGVTQISGVVDEYKDSNGQYQKMKYDDGTHSAWKNSDEVEDWKFKTNSNVNMTETLFILIDEYLKFASRGIMIHGVNSVNIGNPASLGCIRMQSGNPSDLLHQVSLGITYKKSKGSDGKELYRRTFVQPDRDVREFRDPNTKFGGGAWFAVIDPAKYDYVYDPTQRIFQKK